MNLISKLPNKLPSNVLFSIYLETESVCKSEIRMIPRNCYVERVKQEYINVRQEKYKDTHSRV